MLFITLFSTVTFAASDTLLKGLYVCESGNNDSICDQNVQVFATSGQVTAVRVEYVGWCGSMGPYTYYCDGEVCEDPGIRIELRSATTYHWENKQYGFRCDFRKKP